MILVRSLSYRFLSYFLIINTAFTLLFNAIECFEKLTRTNHTTTSTTLTFIKLNFIPSFFDNFSLATWLALVVLIRELALYAEWEGFLLLSIKPKSILYIIACISICLSIVSYIGKEYVFFQLYQQAESVKTKTIKHNNGTLLYDTWFTLKNNNFCHIQQFNYTTNQGIGLTFVTTDQHGIFKTILFANSFKFNHQTEKIQITQATLIQGNQKKIITNKKILFPDLNLNTQKSSNLTLLKLLEEQENNELWNKNINRLLGHLNTALLPILTLILFFMLQRFLYSWSITLIVYPFFLGSSACSQWFINQNAPRIIILLPHFIFLLCMLYLFFSNAKFYQQYKINKNQ